MISILFYRPYGLNLKLFAAYLASDADLPESSFGSNALRIEASVADL